MQQALLDLDGFEIENSLGQPDQIQEIVYAFDDDGLTARYMLEPELDIPCLLFMGAGHRALSERASALFDVTAPDDAALSFSGDADDTVKSTLLRILSVHSLQELTDPMASAALQGAQDASPFIRLNTVQMAQYANHPRMRQILTDLLVTDADPDVKGFATHVLDSQNSGGH